MKEILGEKRSNISSIPCTSGEDSLLPKSISPLNYVEIRIRRNYNFPGNFFVYQNFSNIPHNDIGFLRMYTSLHIMGTMKI